MNIHHRRPVGVEFAIGRRAGFGAGVGRLKGTAAKLVIAAVTWLVVAVAAFWPQTHSR